MPLVIRVRTPYLLMWIKKRWDFLQKHLPNGWKIMQKSEITHVTIKKQDGELKHVCPCIHLDIPVKLMKSLKFAKIITLNWWKMLPKVWEVYTTDNIPVHSGK